MWPKNLGLDVSRESSEKLEIYHALLLKWQKAINLVSGSTLDSAWLRHFADSAQISAYISSEDKVVMDWGSGAGFPALVLAIMRPELEVHAVESDERKCQFMRTVSRETSAPIRIHTDRIENIDFGFVMPDVITARALASVEKLLDYARPVVDLKSGVKMVLLKGENALEELEEAQKRYSFKHSSHESLTAPDASIVVLSEIQKL